MKGSRFFFYSLQTQTWSVNMSSATVLRLSVLSKQLQIQQIMIKQQTVNMKEKCLPLEFCQGLFLWSVFFWHCQLCTTPQVDEHAGTVCKNSQEAGHTLCSLFYTLKKHISFHSKLLPKLAIDEAPAERSSPEWARRGRSHETTTQPGTVAIATRCTSKYQYLLKYLRLRVKLLKGQRAIALIQSTKTTTRKQAVHFLIIVFVIPFVLSDRLSLGETDLVDWTKMTTMAVWNMKKEYFTKIFDWFNICHMQFVHDTTGGD